MTDTQPVLSADTQAMLDALQTAARETLDRKRRLGQYAIVWQDGQPQRLDGPQLEALAEHGFGKPAE
jgi:hypothetical protein